MTLNEYQEAAMGTCMPSSNNFAYMILNLQGEVGEFCSKVAKAIQKEQFIVDSNYLCSCPKMGPFTHEEFKNLSKDEIRKMCDEAAEIIQKHDEELCKECGDILWQLAGLAKVMGWDLESVAQMNLDKLAARKEAGTIAGNGDGISGKERTV